jgi:hypothetical protein
MNGTNLQSSPSRPFIESSAAADLNEITRDLMTETERDFEKEMFLSILA